MVSRWEYRITRYNIRELAREEEAPAPEGAFVCDKEGQCFLHDTSLAAADLIRDALNEEGRSGWELVQFGYHKHDLMCVWKRMVERD